MCIKFIKKLNLFNREQSQITKSDIILSYMFIISMLYIIGWFSYKYYEIGSDDIDKCTKSNIVCIKDEFITLVVPYFGVVYGFICTAFKFTDAISLFINYVCCCYACCCNEKNTNVMENNIEIEIVNV